MNAQPAAKKRPVVLIVIGIIAVLCVICIAGLLAMEAMGLLPETTPFPTYAPLPTSTIPPTRSPAQTYFDEYGGNIDVYNEILSLTDCAILQEKFDIAYANNQREIAGTKEFKWTLGYMTAANDHMKAIGCYNN